MREGEKKITEFGDPEQVVACTLHECKSCGKVMRVRTSNLVDLCCEKPKPRYRKIFSSYGKVTFLDWCKRERDRMNARGDSVRIDERKGFICLTR